MLHDRTTPHLTSRERQVINLVALGLSAKEAAVELAIAPCTVERHIENVRLKTRTRNRSHMVAYVIKSGMLDIPIAADIHARRIQLPLSLPLISHSVRDQTIGHSPFGPPIR